MLQTDRQIPQEQSISAGEMYSSKCVVLVDHFSLTLT